MAIPDTTRRLLARRLDTHRQQRWPNLAELNIGFRGDFVYLTSIDFTGDPMPLCRLTYKKNADLWKKLGCTDLEFVFTDLDASNPLEQAQIDEILLRSGVLIVNEVRKTRGLPELV